MKAHVPRSHVQADRQASFSSGLPLQLPNSPEPKFVRLQTPTFALTQ